MHVTIKYIVRIVVSITKPGIISVKVSVMKTMRRGASKLAPSVTAICVK